MHFFAEKFFLKEKSFHDTLNFSIRFIPFDPHWIFFSFCNKFALSWNYRARQSCRMNNNKQCMQQMMSTLAIYTYSSSHKRNSSCCSCFFFSLFIIHSYGCSRTTCVFTWPLIKRMLLGPLKIGLEARAWNYIQKSCDIPLWMRW